MITATHARSINKELKITFTYKRGLWINLIRALLMYNVVIGSRIWLHLPDWINGQVSTRTQASINNNTSCYMQIQSLKVFCDLKETESFTKAAQINNITQSAVSQQIGSLEKQFETLLIERSKKKFRLTREGIALYDYSKQIIQTYDSLLNHLQEIKDIVSGTIRISTIYSVGLHELPPYMKRFLKAFQTVNVHVLPAIQNALPTCR